jgi:hypothetical protein
MSATTTHAKTSVGMHWYDKMSVCAVQLKQKLMLHRNGSRMRKATCSCETTASLIPYKQTVQTDRQMDKVILTDDLHIVNVPKRIL